jgi:pimeloyl-ACP methyl ester carboxylesterase
MNYIDVFYPSDDGLRLYARDYPAPHAGARTLLCLPGLTRNSKDFAPLAESLNARYRVICPDQRGRGRSARDPDPARYRLDRYAQDMKTLLDLLNVQDVVLVGTSLGGLMSMMLMATDTTRFRAAIINDIGPEIDPVGMARIASYVGKTAPPRDWREAIDQTAFINGVAFPDFTRGDWASMARDLYVQEGATPILDYDPGIALGVASGAVSASLWPLFDMIVPRPMLVIRGEHSDILSAETVSAMRKRLPDIRDATIPKRGHAPTLMEPESRQAIDAFLQSLD